MSIQEGIDGVDMDLQGTDAVDYTHTISNETFPEDFRGQQVCLMRSLCFI